jgi:hypothetical protein
MIAVKFFHIKTTGVKKPPGGGFDWRVMSNRSIWGILRSGWAFGFANRANNRNPPILVLTRIEDRFSPVIVAICAYIMRRFYALQRFFKGIGDASRPGAYQFVAYLLAIPVFHFGNLFFKIAYLLNQRRLNRLGFKKVTLSTEKRTINLGHLPGNISDALDLKKSLDQVTSELNAGNSPMN